MGDKIGSGAWHEAGPSDPKAARPDRTEIERLTERRNNARWTGVVGFAMMFAGSLLTALVLGGAVMAAYGTVASMYWSWRIRKLKGDPWAYDPELDGPRIGEP